MKRSIILAAIILLAFSSCTKKHDTACYNTVTVTDGSKTHSACGNDRLSSGQLVTGILVAFIQKPANSMFTVFAGNNYPFSLNIQDTSGPVGGLGTYTLQAADSNANVYKENFSGGQSYKCSGGSINVTHFDTSNISGTFTINIFNSTTSKVISGAFNANQPDIVWY